MTSAIRMAGRNRHLAEAILLMERHLEAPLPLDGIAGAVGLSARQLTRLFLGRLAGRPGSSISSCGSTAPPACSARPG